MEDDGEDLDACFRSKLENIRKPRKMWGTRACDVRQWNERRWMGHVNDVVGL